MPEITEKQFKEYVDLKKKEVLRQEEIDKMFERGVSKVKKWRKDMYSTRGFASVFANELQKEYEKRRRPNIFVLDRWSVVKKYLTPRVVKSNNLDPYFRELLGKYGWAIKIDKKYGLFEVIKIL